MFVFRDATESVGRRSRSRKCAARHTDEQKQQDQQLNLLEQNDRPGSTSPATDSTSILPALALNRQHEATDHELGQGESTRTEARNENKCDSHPRAQCLGNADAKDSVLPPSSTVDYNEQSQVCAAPFVRSKTPATFERSATAPISYFPDPDVDDF